MFFAKNEVIELEELGFINFGDPALRVTDTQVRNSQLVLWADYHLSEAQQRRMSVWRSGTISNAQGLGFGPSHVWEYPGWLPLKKIALEDAARAAIRSLLRSTERNRPKEATGIISLASFPRFYIDSGRWAVSARFRVQIIEIIPFAVH